MSNNFQVSSLQTFFYEKFQILVKFLFSSSAGNWRMNQVEIEPVGKGLLTLTAVGRYPSAPKGFSYVCYDTFLFKNREASLKLSDIQVWMNEHLNKRIS